MSSKKIKLYKNSKRNNQQQNKPTPYVPQYKSIGIEPNQVNFGESQANILIIKNAENESNTRKRPLAIAQPYATLEESSIKPISPGEFPNVGNNIEQVWLGVDHIMDGDNLDPNHEMIDNNFMDEDVVEPEQDSKNNILEHNVNLNESNNSDNKDYILIYNNKIFAIDDLTNIQELASQMVFGEHEICNNGPISVKDILVLKKVKLKIGLFLE